MRTSEQQQSRPGSPTLERTRMPADNRTDWIAFALMPSWSVHRRDVASVACASPQYSSGMARQRARNNEAENSARGRSASTAVQQADATMADGAGRRHNRWLRPTAAADLGIRGRGHGRPKKICVSLYELVRRDVGIPVRSSLSWGRLARHGCRLAGISCGRRRCPGTHSQ